MESFEIFSCFLFLTFSTIASPPSPQSLDIVFIAFPSPRSRAFSKPSKYGKLRADFSGGGVYVHGVCVSLKIMFFWPRFLGNGRRQTLSKTSWVGGKSGEGDFRGEGGVGIQRPGHLSGNALSPVSFFLPKLLANDAPRFDEGDNTDGPFWVELAIEHTRVRSMEAIAMLRRIADISTDPKEFLRFIRFTVINLRNLWIS